MRKIVSTTWPWYHRNLDNVIIRYTPFDVVRIAQELGAQEVCIRTPWRTSLYNPEWHDVLRDQLAFTDIDLSIWAVVALQYPENEARAIQTAVNRYKPVRVVIDAEDAAKQYIANLSRFLEALDRVGCPVGLGSYRRANYHTEMNWPKWLKYRANNGEYTIDFLAHQLYPIKVNTPAGWRKHFQLDIDSHEVYAAAVYRPGIPWLPWVPSFIGGSYEGCDVPWIPKAECLDAAITYMKERLGSRLLGVNFWSLDEDMVDIPDVYQFVKGLSAIAPTPQPNIPVFEIPKDLDQFTIKRV